MLSVRSEEVRGHSIARPGREITPVGRLLRVSWRGGSYSWWRPIGVEVRQGANLRWIPIHDVTRRAIVGIALGAALLGGLAWSAEQIYLRGRKA
jgi:hypothetical protein